MWHTKEIRIYLAGKMESEVLKQTDRTRLISFRRYFWQQLHVHVCSAASVMSSSLQLYGLFSCFSHVQLFATLWTAAHQAPLSMGFSRQECWTGLPCPPPGDLPNPGIEPMSPALQADSLPLSHQGSPFGTSCCC